MWTPRSECEGCELYKAAVYRYGHILDDKEEMEELIDAVEAKRAVMTIRRVTGRMRAASNRNIAKAQVSRIRRREVRSVGRATRQRTRGSRFI